MFKKILIANRGEIACRVAATCKRLGVLSVAVYSDADADGLHVASCDAAVHIGAAAAADSYLQIDRIIAAARTTGAEAVHPGYGFLSENEAFAAACSAAGIVFIGPPVAAIAAMGSKAAAKALMQAAAVPLVPGYHGAEQNPALLHREADAIGYPVLLKASAGGGGKGMRVVEHSDAFEAALASCKREAASSFGNDRVLIEKYLLRPRHVEVQVFADQHGHAVYLFDRDCSVQRRHQKVLEEAPAPGLNAAQRQAMGEAAVAAARAVDYVGAGTVEFIMTPDGQFYFMEMNTRLQVEHPVTEMITGLDLVEWQLRVAAGEPLPLAQAALVASGHAIEARIYAENPAGGFLPSTGTIRHMHTPAALGFRVGAAARAPVRIDSGVREGDTITPFYDPMIAKLIVYGADRATALARLSAALREFEIVGPHTNVEFLQRLVASAPFMAADLDTGLIERHHDTLFAAVPRSTPQALALCCAALLARQSDGGRGDAARAAPRPDSAPASASMPASSSCSVSRSPSPWQALPYWRLNADYQQTFSWHEAGTDKTSDVPFVQHGDSMTLEFDGLRLPFAWRRGAAANDFIVTLGSNRINGRVFVAGTTFHAFTEGVESVFDWLDPLAFAADAELGVGRLTAPMPGKIIAILVAAGARVEKGAPLLVMEAMKMEHTIGAPSAGTVGEILYAVGDQVADGAQLLTLEVA